MTPGRNPDQPQTDPCKTKELSISARHLLEHLQKTHSPPAIAFWRSTRVHTARVRFSPLIMGMSEVQEAVVVTRVVVFQHVPHEHLGALNEIFRASGLAVQVVPLYAGRPRSMDWTGILGLVVLGGPMNVDETRTYPFLGRELQWIKQALTCEVPILGICLGAQLLAKALKSRVYPNPVKEIGWHPVHLTEASSSDFLFAGMPAELVTFQWHGDTFDMPQGAELLATARDCRHQAFRFGAHAWGLQFHPEMTNEMIEDWLSAPENAGDLSLLPKDEAESIRSKTPLMMRRYRTWTTTVLERFAECCGRRKRLCK